MKKSFNWVSFCLFFSFFCFVPGVGYADFPATQKTESGFGKIPSAFIPNQGQLDERVACYVQGRDKTIYFTAEGLTHVLSGTEESEREDSGKGGPSGMKSPRRWVVKQNFLGANTGVIPSSPASRGIRRTGKRGFRPTPNLIIGSFVRGSISSIMVRLEFEEQKGMESK